MRTTTERKSAVMLAVVLSALIAAPVGRAQAPNLITRESTLTATVDQLDRHSRMVTFRGEGNVLQTVYVDPGVTALDDLKVGDLVTVRYVESVIVQVRPGAALTDVRDSTEEARKTGHENVLQQLKAVVTIENVDPQGLFVTYRTKDNLAVVRAVNDKRLLEGIRPGQRVEVTLTRARAVSIERNRR